MTKTKKAQRHSLEFIICAALASIVLITLISIFTQLTEKVDSEEGECLLWEIKSKKVDGVIAYLSHKQLLEENETFNFDYEITCLRREEREFANLHKSDCEFNGVTVNNEPICSYYNLNCDVTYTNGTKRHFDIFDFYYMPNILYICDDIDVENFNDLRENYLNITCYNKDEIGWLC